MICPHCKTPNPDTEISCIACSRTLSDPAAARSVGEDDVESMATMAGPKTLKEWASGQVSSAAAISIVLPEGLEIGHRYRVVRLLGVGGMGAVYKVHDRELDRDVALKLIRSDIAADLSALERFKREIQLSSRITHKNVLRVYDLGESDGIKFLTMQFVEGEDLEGLLKREGKLPVPRLLPILRQICEGLAAAHEQGVVHRDLKPQNILLDKSDRVLVADFGLAKSVEQSGVTQTGTVIGTPFYMSPEQVKGEPAEARSDIFSLGVILYKMATGVLPYTGNSPYEVMAQRVQRPPRPAGEVNPEIPSYLRHVIDRCLAIDPALRYATATEIVAELDSGSFRPTLRYRMRRRRWLLPAAGLLAALLAISGGWWISRAKTAPSAAASKPQTVLIADFVNRTGDPVFDGTLEPAFGISLEGASFITSYSRASARKIAAQLQPGAPGLDEPLARLVAVREGIGVVTSGSVDRKKDGYEVAVRAIDATTGKSILTDRQEASGKDAVLSAVTKLAARVRTELGDTTPPSEQLAAAETFTAGSLEAAHEYAVAQELQWAGKWEEAIQRYKRAVDLDPNLGRAYAGLAAVENNRGRRQQAEEYYKLALSRIDRMSDREKYRTRGGYYLLTRKPDSAIQEFSALVKQYPADSAGIANLAAAYFFKRDMPRALQEGKRAIEIYPKNVPQRNNYGLYAMYAGDFATSIREQQAVLQMNPAFELAYVGLALSQLGEGQVAEATETWKKLEGLGPRGASMAASGLADLALYEGRLSDGKAILGKGIEADLAQKSPEDAARKRAMLAEAHLLAAETASAVAAAERARAESTDDAVAVSAARVFAQAGEEKKALAVASDLEKRFEPDPQMYARLIRGEAELKRKNLREAISHFKEAQKLADSWVVRFDLGRAYLEAGAFTEADGEFEACLKRRGEATALFLDEAPTYRLFPAVHYYLGRVREGLKSPGAAEAFKNFLAVKKEESDPLVADARRRLAGR